MARYALRNPWWSLSNFAATKGASQIQGDAKQVHWQLSAEATEASTSQVTGFKYKEPRTDEEVQSLLCVEVYVCFPDTIPFYLHGTFEYRAVEQSL